ncbi:LysR family transcriptional regulator ArgP [Rathayibacter soli]|uniref:LysR family transcriptional regulator ArgP n=1 Tax=Rathayibacter soli TaxID=3144168 RepID=UPI0027E4E24A|nr:LysR family transcriptional regulator ArgP [Glaciibacter superstes]
MELQLEQLRAFVAVVDSGTFEAAARQLRVTPSAISQRIKALEGSVGRVLLQRVKPVRVTSSGEAVLRLARQVTLLEDEAAQALGVEVRGGGGAERGAAQGSAAAGDVSAGDASTAGPGDPDAVRPFTSIPLVINSDSLATWALPALARVAAAHRVVFDVFREDQDHSTARLRDGSVMAAITSVSDPVQGCIVRPLGQMRYRPMANPEFADRWFANGVTASALRAAPVVIYDRSDDLQDRYLRQHEARGDHSGHGGELPAQPRHFIPASSEFFTAVRLGLGWGMLPAAQIGELEATGELVAIGEDDIRVPLYWQQWRLHSRLLGAVADEIAVVAAHSLR